jgi:hypothetical protein
MRVVTISRNWRIVQGVSVILRSMIKIDKWLQWFNKARTSKDSTRWRTHISQIIECLYLYQEYFTYKDSTFCIWTRCTVQLPWEWGSYQMSRAQACSPVKNEIPGRLALSRQAFLIISVWVNWQDSLLHLWDKMTQWKLWVSWSICDHRAAN